MFMKLIRLGRDSEIRQLQGGTQVLNFAGAYDVGYGDNKRTQWIDCAMWGDRAAKVAPHLLKGSQVVVYADDLEIETYQKGDGSTGSKLKCRVVNFDFAGDRPQQSGQQQAPQKQQGRNNPNGSQQSPSAPAGNVDDFDDDFPF